jgi:protein-disulfide isomerase
MEEYKSHEESPAARRHFEQPKEEPKHHHEHKEHHSHHVPHKREEPAKKASSSKPENTNKMLLGASIVQILLLVFIAFQINGLGAGVAVADGAAPSAAAPSAPAAARADVDADDDPVLGDPNAPVTIIEFSDYECPFCGRFYSQTLPQIKSNYIDTGKVKLVYRDFPLSFHQMAEPSALAANCAADQDKFWEFHDKAFENQGSLSEATLTAWAQELGLEMNAWNECRRDPQRREEIRSDLRDGTAAGVQGTPAFFVNGQLISGAQPFQAFEQLIEAELSG